MQYTSKTNRKLYI